MWRRGAVMTEGWKRGASALCEQFVVEHRGCGSGACTWRRRRRLCQKRQHSSWIFLFPVVRLLTSPARLLVFARYLWNLSLAVSPRSRSTKLAQSRSVDASCVASSVTAVNRCAKMVSEVYGGVCCVSASNLSTTKCLADDGRGCFLIATETHLTSNTFLTCSELWTCPERRARLVVIVVAVAGQSASLSGDRCCGVGGRCPACQPISDRRRHL